MNFEQIEIVAESLEAAGCLGLGLERFGDSNRLASSFGAEDVVLIEWLPEYAHASKYLPWIRTFSFRKPISLIDTIEKKYGIQIDRRQSRLTPQQQEEQFIPQLWTRNRTSAAISAKSNR